MIKQWIQSWLGIKQLRVDLDNLMPKDFGKRGFDKINFKGQPVYPLDDFHAGELHNVDGRPTPLLTKPIVKGYEPK